jgi:hypothetical protein
MTDTTDKDPEHHDPEGRDGFDGRLNAGRK